jgi:hypothetical protein
MPRALPDHGVERVREEAARAAVEAADVLEVPGFFQVPFDEAQVTLAVQLVPDGDCFGWKATILLLPQPTNTTDWPSESHSPKIA